MNPSDERSYEPTACRTWWWPGALERAGDIVFVLSALDGLERNCNLFHALVARALLRDWPGPTVRGVAPDPWAVLASRAALRLSVAPVR
jgi:hypothetical protein